jgi:hypothetical protein
MGSWHQDLVVQKVLDEEIGASDSKSYRLFTKH